MKTLILTTASGFALVAAAACDGMQDDTVAERDDMGGYEQNEDTEENREDYAQNDTSMGYGQDSDDMSDTADLGDDNMSEDDNRYELAMDEYRASTLIGAQVFGPSGEEIATIADVKLDLSSGEATALILRDGGTLGLGGELVQMRPDRATLNWSEDGEANAFIALDEEALESLTTFEQEGLNDYRLASEIIGTEADLADSDQSVRIFDIVMTNAGSAEQIAVTDGIEGRFTDTAAVIPFDTLEVTQGDDDAEVTLDTDMATIESTERIKKDRG